MTRVLRARGVDVEVVANVPRRGLAQQRQFLLDRADAPLVLFLDDDVLIEPDLIARLQRAIETTACGFVGSFVNAPSAVGASAGIDRCPDDLDIQPWDGAVTPERVTPGSRAWDRYRLHFSAYLDAVCRRRGITRENEVLYKVAWVGGCVMFDAAKLRAAGGFDFWPQLPARHVGEDVLAQLRVMERFGGAGLAPSGAGHQDVPTTLTDRRVDAPFALA